MSNEDVPIWVKRNLARAKSNVVKREFRAMLRDGNTAKHIMERLKYHATLDTGLDAGLGRNQLAAISMIFDRALGRPQQHVEETKTSVKIKRIEFTGAPPVLPPTGAHLKLLEQTDSGWRRADGLPQTAHSVSEIEVSGSFSMLGQSTPGRDFGETHSQPSTTQDPDASNTDETD